MTDVVMELSDESSDDQEVSVRDLIRRDISSGVFAPNQRLIEAELCKQYDASRLVVRAALQDLANDGLVEMQRNRGARVRVIALQEALEIVEVRRALEGLSAARAARLASDDDIAELQDIAVRMRQAIAGGEVLTYSGLNARLHQVIQRISNNLTCTKTLERLSSQIVRHQFALALRPGRGAVSLVQHEAIVKAIADRDSDAAEAAMRAHLANVAEEMPKLP
jgi:DNA-binding GntR family transcriptional regulator